MKGECLPFTAVPHSTSLFLDYLYHFPRVQSFYPRPPTARDWVQAEAQSLSYPEERRQAIAAVLEAQNRAWGASATTLENIARLRAGALAIVTGQQVGLFGGPLMGLLKALSAVRLAAHATAAGLDAVPIFWMATEDHDLAEINHATLPFEDGLRTLVSRASGVPDAPVAGVQFPTEIEALVAEAVALLPESEITQLLRQCYRPGESFATAFARLYANLLGEFGVVMLDASDPQLDRIAAPVYRAVLLASAELRQRLMERGAELRGAGYHEQVKVSDSSTLLFYFQDGARVPIQAQDGGFRIGDQRLSSEQLQQQATESPELFSPNALLRPVVQDFLLPTVAYIGGPSEVAYFAQAGVLYEELLGRITPILPRLSATLIDARAQRLLSQYDLKLTDVFAGAEGLRRELAARVLPSSIQEQFADMRRHLHESLTGMKESLTRLDPTLAEATERAGSKMLYQMENLEGRAATVLSRRDAEVSRHSDWLSSMLFPNKNLQEREIAGIWFVARHGRELLRRIYDFAQDTCPDHQMLYL